MRAFVSLLLLALFAAPGASAGAEGDCTTTDVGLVCVGDYSWTDGDEGCEGDSVHEEGNGVWTETVAGHASASGFHYCNVYYDSSYYESGVRARVDTDAAFLEVSWNKWRYDDPTQHLEGCSTWIYYEGPAYGYFNNVGCPAGDPPEPWNEPSAPGVPQGCTFLPAGYACVLEETDDCGGVTALGGGVPGIVGGAVAGSDGCATDTFVATGSVGVVFVNAGWSDRGASGCHVWLHGNSLPTLLLPCAPGGMPTPGWGHILP